MMTRQKIEKTIVHEKKIASRKKLIPAFAYLRVSDPKQKDDNSLGEQRMGSERWAKQNGYHICYFFTSQESAFKEGRKTFGLMVEVSKAQDVKHFIFKDSSRKARNRTDNAFVDDLVENHGFSYSYYLYNRTINAENLDDQFLHNSMESAFDEEFSRRQRKKTLESVRNRTEQNLHVGSVPIGYVKTTVRGGPPRIEKDPEAGKVPLICFELLVKQDYSLSEIKDHLIKEKITGPRGGFYDPRKILRNWTYAGVLNGYDCSPKLDDDGNYRTIQNPGFKPYWSIKDHKKILKKLQSRSCGGWKNGPRKDVLLRRFVKCTSCGVHLWVEKVNDHWNFAHKSNCKQKRISERKIFAAVEKEIQRIRYTPLMAEVIKDLVKSIGATQKGRHRDERKKLEQEVARFNNRINKLVDDRADDLIDATLFQERLSYYKEQIESINEQIDSLDTGNAQAVRTIGEYIDKLVKMPEAYFKADREQKAKILRLMVDKIHWDPAKGEVILVWRLPFSILLSPRFLKLKDKIEEVRAQSGQGGSEKPGPLILPRAGGNCDYPPVPPTLTFPLGYCILRFGRNDSQGTLVI